jgi:hypothetical protein
VETVEDTPFVVGVLQQGHASLVKGKIDVPVPAPKYPEPAVEAPSLPVKVVVAKGGKGAKGAEDGQDTVLEVSEEADGSV